MYWTFNCIITVVCVELDFRGHNYWFQIEIAAEAVIID